MKSGVYTWSIQVDKFEGAAAADETLDVGIVSTSHPFDDSIQLGSQLMGWAYRIGSGCCYSGGVDLTTGHPKVTKGSIVTLTLDLRVGSSHNGSLCVCVNHGPSYELCSGLLDNFDLNTAPGVVASTDYSKILTDFYRKYNPTRLPDVPKLLARYKGKETQMFKILAAKYNTANPLYAANGAPTLGFDVPVSSSSAEAADFARNASAFSLGPVAPASSTAPATQPPSAPGFSLVPAVSLTEKCQVRFLGFDAIYA